MNEPWPGRNFVRAAILVLLGSLMAVLALNMDKLDWDKFRSWGYVGVFAMAMIGSSTIILPIPHLAFTFTMGAALNPWFIGLCAGLGDGLGEVTGYVAGYAVEDWAGRSRLYVLLESWMRRNGDLTIFVLSLLPVPFFDLAAMAGGVVGYPLWRFMLATWSGKTIKAVVAAWGGYYGIGWIASLVGAS